MHTLPGLLLLHCERFRGRARCLLEIEHGYHHQAFITQINKDGYGLTAGGLRCPGDREVARVHSAGFLLREENMMFLNLNLNGA